MPPVAMIAAEVASAIAPMLAMGAMALGQQQSNAADKDEGAIQDKKKEEAAAEKSQDAADKPKTHI